MTSVLLSIKSHYRDQIRIGVSLKFLFPLLYLRIGLYVKTTIVLNVEALPEIWDGIYKISCFYEQQVSEFCKEDAARVEIIQDLQNRLNSINNIATQNIFFSSSTRYSLVVSSKTMASGTKQKFDRNSLTTSPTDHHEKRTTEYQKL
ncbi:hypothetical protein GQX74_005430 [Glossina fuscipes]|nr:hypothetical protein GQX74_005430 [Glossina fuscipes]